MQFLLVSACRACSPAVAILPAFATGLWLLPSVFPAKVVLAFDLVMCAAGSGGWPEAPAWLGPLGLILFLFKTSKRVWEGVLCVRI